jgi:hypothetical protein
MRYIPCHFPRGKGENTKHIGEKTFIGEKPTKTLCVPRRSYWLTGNLLIPVRQFL